MRSLKLNFLLFVFICLGPVGQSQHMDITVTHKKNADESIDFYYKKLLPGSYIVAVKFSNIKNAYESDFQGTVRGPTGKLFKLRPISSNTPIIFSYRTYYVLGVHEPKVDSMFSYSLPFKKGSSLQVKPVNNLEAFLNKDEPKNWKAFQFISKQDTVRAIRKGMVVQITKNNYENSRGVFSDKKNKIIVEHEDGTYAQYHGFVNTGIFVQEGQTIYPSTKLGVLMDKTNAVKNNLILFLYFNDRVDITENDDKSDHNIYINPYFITGKFKEQLQPSQTYIVEFNSDLFTAEFTRRQLKKFKKGELLID